LCCLQPMDLSGAFSNPQLPLKSLLERVNELRAKPASPSEARKTAAPVPARAGRVSQAVPDVLALADAPMRVKDIHRDCEALLGEPVKLST
jgi:hypothetical protein